MINKKFLKAGVISVFLGTTTFGLSSCSFTREGVLTTYSPTDFLASNNSPLNSSFNNAPISTYAASALYNLLSYQTTGSFEFSGNDTTTKVVTSPKDTLILEGAKAVIVFKDKTTMEAFDTQKKIDLTKDDDKDLTTWVNDLKASLSSSESSQAHGESSSTTSLKEGTDYWIFFRDKGGIQYQNGTSDTSISENTTQYYNDAISNGTVYQFLIDTDNYWVNNKGEKQVQVSSKDFERAIESYTLASDLNYNRNGYFLDLLGLNFNETVGYKKTDSSDYESITSANYNVENYTNNNDKFFTAYINTPYPYTFGLLAKEYFSAMPHTNQLVHNISLASGTPIKTTMVDGSLTIDQSATDWSRIYGSGGVGKFTNNVWYAGAYYVSAFTSSQLIFQLNNTYMETTGKNLLDWSTGKERPENSSDDGQEKKIQTVSISYGSGSADTYYEMFKSHQNDYLAAVPSVKMSEAAELFAGKGLSPTKVVQTSQSNYIVYTPSPYVTNTSGTVSENSYLVNMAKFIYDWNSKNSVIIRAAISGLVNYYQLSLLNLPGSGDFQLSATPYGVLSNYYETVASGDMNGALPRPYSDYKNSSSTELGQFTIPYYTYNSSNINVENVTVSKSSLKTALESYGATSTNPLQFSIKFGEGSFSTNYTNFLNKMKSSIESISDGLIKVNIVARNATTPSVTDWYNSQTSPLGFSYWSPDYNGVGTWIEADTTLQTVSVGDKKYEGVPATNAHNSFHTFLESMVTAVKLMNATWNSEKGQYEVKTKPSDDPFSSDTRIQSTFSDSTLTKMGVGLSETKDTSTYDATYALQKDVKPGVRYGLLAIGLLNTMFSNKVFKTDGYTSTTSKDNTSKPIFQKYVDDPSLLNLTNQPTTIDQLYSGGDVIVDNMSGSFAKWIGVYAGQSTEKAVYENFVLDSDYSFIPRSESGLNDITYSLVNPLYVARVGTQQTTYRDFGLSGK